MLKELIDSGYGQAEDYNCAEKIIHGANKIYNLGLDHNACKLLAGFGGGMGAEKLCGAVASAVAVIGYMFIEDNAHKSPQAKELTKKYIDLYTKKMGDIECGYLKENFRKEDTVKCLPVISVAAEVMDEIIAQERNR